MIAKPEHSEIDHHTSKLIIGSIAISLACITDFFAPSSLNSISASYHAGGWSRDIFVGFLFAISAFLMAYNGNSKYEMIISKIASLAGLGVAMFPCICGDHKEIIPHIHYISAAIMFVILALFCLSFYKRARSKENFQANIRAAIYAICGSVIVASILVLAIDAAFNEVISSKIERIVYYGESAGLIAFGVAWLAASRMIPVITAKKDRLSIFTARKNSTQ